MDKKTSYKLDTLNMQTVPERIEEELRSYLKNNNFEPGDSIPTEMELAEYLGVSRSAIREALSRLRMLGLIESRKKRGMVLTSPNILNGLERVLYPSFLDKKTILEIFEMRLVIELGMADLLFMRKTSKDLVQLQNLIDGDEDTLEVSSRMNKEVKFHSKLYDITRNKSLLEFQKLLLPIFDFVVKNEEKIKIPPLKTSISHQDLLHILKNGDSLEFKIAMQEHLRPHFEALVFYRENS